MGYIGPEPKLGRNREVDDISGSFNGSTTAFTLQVGSVNASPGSANSLIVSVGGVVQNPNTDYTVSASTLTFTTAPASGLSFFALILGQGIDQPISTPSDNSITTAKLVDGAVTAAKLAKPIDLADNEKIRFGTGNDLEIYHDGSGSYVLNSAGSGQLTISSDNALNLASRTGTEYFFRAYTNGAAELYHNNVKKFETASGGVSLTGGAAANITALSDGSTITVDFATACHHSVTLGGNRTLSGTNSGTHVGQSGSIFITQDGTGSRTLAYDSAYKFAGGTAPTLSTAANAIDRLDYIIKASGVIQAVLTLDVK